MRSDAFWRERIDKDYIWMSEKVKFHLPIRSFIAFDWDPIKPTCSLEDNKKKKY